MHADMNRRKFIAAATAGAGLLARTLQPMSDLERQQISRMLSSATADGTLPYTAPGYCDGTWA